MHRKKKWEACRLPFGGFVMLCRSTVELEWGRNYVGLFLFLFITSFSDREQEASLQEAQRRPLAQPYPLAWFPSTLCLTSPPHSSAKPSRDSTEYHCGFLTYRQSLTPIWIPSNQPISVQSKLRFSVSAAICSYLQLSLSPHSTGLR